MLTAVIRGKYLYRNQKKEFLRKKIDAFLNKEQVWVTKEKKKGKRSIDLRKGVAGIVLNENNSLEMTLEITKNGSANPIILLENIFDMKDGEANFLKIVKTKIAFRN